MAELDEALSVLRKIEQNQVRSLEMQMEQLALVKAQVARSEAQIHESIALQKIGNQRQARVVNVALPILFAALLYVGYLLYKHS